METLKKQLPFLLIFAACFALYGQTLGFYFVWDDHMEVLMQDRFRLWKNLGLFFTTPYTQIATGGFSPFHRPLVPVMILLISTFSGTNPVGYHLANLLLYSGTACLFYAFLKKFPVSEWARAAAVLIFILHPVHAEAVSWATARPVLLSGFCFISALICSAKLAEADCRKKIFFLLALCYASGLLTYHSILGLPVLVFFMDWLKLPAGNKLWKTRIPEYLLYIFLTGACVGYFMWVFHRTGDEVDLRPYYNAATANIVYTGGPMEWLLTPLNTLTRYSEKLIFPLILIPDHYFKSTELSLSACAGFLIIILVTLFLLFHSPRRKTVLFSVIWMLAGLATVLNLVPQGGLFAERYLYISSMGFALWAALGLEHLKEAWEERKQSKLLIAGFLSVIFIFYGIRTVTYSQTWSNDIRYWLEASILAPHKARTHNRLGTLLAAAGHNEEAEKEFRKTLELEPEEFFMVYHRLSEVLAKQGKNDEAKIMEDFFQRKLQEKTENDGKNPFSAPDEVSLRIN